MLHELGKFSASAAMAHNKWTSNLISRIFRASQTSRLAIAFFEPRGMSSFEPTKTGTTSGENVLPCRAIPISSLPLSELNSGIKLAFLFNYLFRTFTRSSGLSTTSECVHDNPTTTILIGCRLAHAIVRALQASLKPLGGRDRYFSSVAKR